MVHTPVALKEPEKSSEIVRLACRAMASRFEIVLHGEDPAHLRAAGEEALAEIERIDAQLTRFRATSTIGRINAGAGHSAVRVNARLFDLLTTCQCLYEETGGAFDITVGPLMQTWSTVHQSGRLPDGAALKEARSRTGMNLVELDAEAHTVRFTRPGVVLDLGAIGKGYAVDEAILILRDLGVESAFIHGGTSTMAAIGRPPEADAWIVAIPHPDESGTSGDVLHTVPLRDAALSVSAVWGRKFIADDVSYGHVLDPRLGRPVASVQLAAVEMRCATPADALSTALLVMGEDGKSLEERHADLRALIVRDGDTTKCAQARPPERLPPGVTVW